MGSGGLFDNLYIQYIITRSIKNGGLFDNLYIMYIHDKICVIYNTRSIYFFTTEKPKSFFLMGQIALSIFAGKG